MTVAAQRKPPRRPCNCGKKRTPEQDARMIARASAEIASTRVWRGTGHTEMGR
jgi:hypothetical protein